jgi:hypothetical protein
MNDKPITTFNMEYSSDETKGMTLVTANPIMAIIMTIMMSPRSALITLKAFPRASKTSVSSITIITNVRITTGINTIVIDRSIPKIAAIVNGTILLKT